MSAVTDVQIILNDQGVFWPTQRVLDAINEAQWDCWVRTKWNWTSASLTLTPGTDLIRLPSNIVIPKFVEDNGLRYFNSTQRELETFHRTWKLDQPAQPMWFITWDAFHIRVYPEPDQVYPNYKLWGLGYPTEILDTATSLSGDSNYVQAVEHLAAGILFDATRPDLADYQRADAEGHLNTYKRNLRNQQSHNIRRLRPGRRFDIQQSGRVYELPVYYPVEC
jgi:hypothetical protein